VQSFERRRVRSVAVGLPDRLIVGLEPQPGQVLEQGRVVCRPRARAVVILDAKQHGSPGDASQPPDMDCVGHVTQMEIPRRGRREPGPQRAADLGQGTDVGLAPTGVV
jgi:hypothetical protein